MVERNIYKCKMEGKTEEGNTVLSIDLDKVDGLGMGCKHRIHKENEIWSIDAFFMKKWIEIYVGTKEECEKEYIKIHDLWDRFYPYG